MTLLSLLLAYSSIATTETPQNSRDPNAEVALVPETEVEISIYDLIHKKNVGPKLPADYAKQVSLVVEKNRPKLMECLPSGEVPKTSFILFLAIEGSGNGIIALDPASSVGVDPSNVFSCVKNTLDAATWPRHPLKESVKVKLPIKLEGKTL